MKKKILSVLMASAMLVSASSAVFASEKTNPDVYVDDALITFADQPAIIENDRTLVPARGVFEAMGAKVDWDQDTQTVTINSKTNTIRVILTIGSPEMTVYTFTSLMNADRNDVTLDVPPQILNDRTLIPLRAISEALNADVQWDQEDYRVDITTTDKPASKDLLPTLSLSAPETAVEADEEFDIYINLSNITPEAWVSGLSAGITYNKEDYQFVSSSLCSTDGTAIENSMVATNDNFSDNALKTVAVTIDEENAAAADGYVMKLTFKSLTGNEGSFALTTGYNSTFGVEYDTTLNLVTGENSSEYLSGNTLNVNTTPLVINGSAEVIDGEEETENTEDADNDETAGEDGAEDDTSEEAAEEA